MAQFPYVQIAAVFKNLPPVHGIAIDKFYYECAAIIFGNRRELQIYAAGATALGNFHDVRRSHTGNDIARLVLKEKIPFLHLLYPIF